MQKPINTFPEYEYKDGKNMYRGVDLGFGGYVYAVPGMYSNVTMLDVANMHGASIVNLNLLGNYTQRYADLRIVRNCVKHKDFVTPRKMFNGKLAKYLVDENEAESLSAALKLPLNSLYGITKAGFENAARDSRNVNNIVALRGALFMKTLQDEVEEKGFKVIHIKTDSIKIPNATQELIDYCMQRANDYGYEFEHECTYDRICLINGSTYIAKYDDKGIRNKGGKHANDWVAVAEQFQVPYVFKTLFSKEPIEFKDKCEVFSVKEGDIYIDMNEGYPDVSMYEKDLKVIQSKYKKGEVNDTTYEKELARLEPEIEKGHNYIFVGRVGQFSPIKEGCGGGVLYRIKDGVKYAVQGTKGYRWLESEVVKSMNKEQDINEDYYIRLVDDAIVAIDKYGDFERFVSDEPYISDNFMDIPELPEGIEEIPFEEVKI